MVGEVDVAGDEVRPVEAAALGLLALVLRVGGAAEGDGAPETAEAAEGFSELGSVSADCVGVVGRELTVAAALPIVAAATRTVVVFMVLVLLVIVETETRCWGKCCGSLCRRSE